jgi:hypothetical protein
MAGSDCATVCSNEGILSNADMELIAESVSTLPGRWYLVPLVG